MVRVLLTDLDGVLRHFDAARMARVAADHGLSSDALAAAAFEPERLKRLVTGELSRAAWVVEVVDRVGPAAEAWLQDRGAIDPSAWDLLQVTRDRVAVGVLTNGTDETRAELRSLGVLAGFDHVFVSAELGVAKPDAALFERVTSDLGVSPGEVAFVDDHRDNVRAAERAGWNAHVFTSVEALGAWLRGLEVDPSNTHRFLAPVRALTSEDIAELQRLVGGLAPGERPASDEVDRLLRWIYDHGLMVPYDWGPWAPRRELGVEDIARGPVEDAVRMLVAVVRSDRFSEGAFASAVRSGMVGACLGRIGEAAAVV